MMKQVKNIKKKSSIYKFLEPYLATGNKDMIAHARSIYWKQYKSEWRKQKRYTNKELTVMLTQDEFAYLKGIAKKHKRSISLFIKESSLAYSRQKFVVPDIFAVHEIKQLLTLNHSDLKRLFDSNQIPYQVGIYVLNQITELETRVLEQLTNPGRG